eukprot:gene11885-8170_t
MDHFCYRRKYGSSLPRLDSNYGDSLLVLLLLFLLILRSVSSSPSLYPPLASSISTHTHLHLPSSFNNRRTYIKQQQRPSLPFLPPEEANNNNNNTRNRNSR